MEDAIPSRVIHHSTTNNTLISEKCVVTGELTGENDMDELGKIEGKVVGNIEAGERIVSPSGDSVIAPSIVLEDDSYFKGKITMTDTPVIDLKNVKTSDKKPEVSQNTVKATS